ncbi:uncharacterized protein LOC122527733 [Frieseomelitta varia]|uniref:uncharacterized protein LOC122527733 n=1 Tax=Frieseomelitta varia TaxID=561572 RepID=UPI001CB69C91|nr:uncharacterized protein LOC122527733 [Frieseomelitta varia]
MENSFNNIEDENVDEKYSSFCSSCNSVLQSVCSIGIPSFHELNSENNLISKIEKKDIAKHSGTINVNEYTLDGKYCRIEKNTFVKNTDTPTKNLIIAMKHHTYEKQKINKNDDDKIGYSITKKIKYIKSLSTDSETKENYITLSDNENKTFTSEIKILKFTKKNTSPSNDDILEDIQNRRKKVLKTIKSILYLCNYINIMREVILQQIHEKQSNKRY